MTIRTPAAVSARIRPIDPAAFRARALAKQRLQAERTNERVIAVILFLVPFVIFIRIDLVTALYLPTALILLLTPFVLLGRTTARIPRGVTVFATLCVLWLGALIVSDLLAGSALSDALRGWVRAGVTLVTTIVLALLVDGRADRAKIFVVGWALGSILIPLAAPDPLLQSNLWKWGFGMPLTALATLVACRPSAAARGRLVLMLPLLLVGVVSIVAGARFVAATALTAVLVMVVVPFLGGRRAPSIKQAIGLGMVGVVLIAVLVPAYGSAARGGLFGEEIQLQAEQQQGPLGLLPGVRSEYFGSVPAIIDSPILGRGSWPIDHGGHYTRLVVENAASAGYAALYYRAQLVSNGGVLIIPSHAHVTQGWIEAGVLGALPWLWVGYLAVRALMAGDPRQSELTPLVVWVAIVVLMDVLFSPYSATRLIYTPFFVVLLSTAAWRRGSEAGVEVTAVTPAKKLTPTPLRRVRPV